MTDAGVVYGAALYALARDEGLSAEILGELDALAAAFSEEADYLRLLSAPNVPKQTRVQLVQDGFSGKLHPYVLSFLKLLTEKGYAKQFPACCRAYRAQFNADNGILPVQAITAVPLSAEQAARLKEKLSGITGKTIELTNRVDAACMGGVRLEYDGKQVDGTVTHRLAAISDMLKSTVL